MKVLINENGKVTDNESRFHLTKLFDEHKGNEVFINIVNVNYSDIIESFYNYRLMLHEIVFSGNEDFLLKDIMLLRLYFSDIISRLNDRLSFVKTLYNELEIKYDNLVNERKIFYFEADKLPPSMASAKAKSYKECVDLSLRMNEVYKDKVEIECTINSCESLCNAINGFKNTGDIISLRNNLGQ